MPGLDVHLRGLELALVHGHLVHHFGGILGKRLLVGLESAASHSCFSS